MQSRTEMTLRGPRRRQRHYSYDESVDESATLLEDEPVEVEQEVPAEDNKSEQQVDLDDGTLHPSVDV